MPWYLTQIRWTERVPSEAETTRLNFVLRCTDWDAPAVTAQGLLDRWRHPMVELPQALGILHALGFPCAGRWVLDPIDAEEDSDAVLNALPWTPSDPAALGGIHRSTAQKLRGVSRRFGPWLPALGVRRKRRRKAWDRGTRRGELGTR